MLNDEIGNNLNNAEANDPSKTMNADAEPEESGKPSWRDAFRTALERARRQQKPGESRQELRRDKSKAMVLLAGGAAVLLLLFFVIFSSPKQRTPLPGENAHGQASLGRKATPGQESSDPSKAVAPLLSADVRATDPGLAGRVTPEDVGRTSKTGSTTPAATLGHSGAPQDYALGKVDFSDPLVGAGSTLPPPPIAPIPEASTIVHQTPELKKPSLVFVRSVEAKRAIRSRPPEEEDETLALAAGTRLVARLEAPVSSAVSAPVEAVVEYNYERNGQIVLPAGAKVFGRLAQVNQSGYVGIQFNRVEMPDGTAQKIDASAMDLNFGPLKGVVSGKKTGTKFLVRSLTGLGTVASYIVGPQGSSSAGLITTNTLMRERLADNVATAGQEQLNSLAFSQNPVVTVPGNTRFYIVLQKPTSDHAAPGSGARNTSTNAAGVAGGVPTLEELRQLMQLRREINELYTQSSQSLTQPQQP